MITVPWGLTPSGYRPMKPGITQLPGTYFPRYPFAQPSALSLTCSEGIARFPSGSISGKPNSTPDLEGQPLDVRARGSVTEACQS